MTRRRWSPIDLGMAAFIALVILGSLIWVAGWIR